MKALRAIVAAAGLVALSCLPASAQKSADNLRVVWRDALPNIDPYFNALRVGLVVAHQFMDTLVYRDPDTFALKPLLATSWKQVDDVTIDFELRQGVKFHNGDAFSADDVVYTINTVVAPDSKVTVPSNFNWIKSAEKLGEHAVRVHLVKPFPTALEYFALVVHIWPKEYRSKVGPEGYSKAPIGTGPYKIARVDGVAQIDLVRNEDYFAESPKGKAKIGKLTIRAVPDAATEMTELLSGRADWIWNFNADQFDRVGKMPNLTAIRAESMRIGFVDIDAAGRTGAGNPLTKPAVRKAILHAIDRETIAKQLVQGGSRVPNAPCFPTQFGCDDGAAVKYEYNPQKAKQLLAEAGFPNGFSTEIVAFRNPQWTAAIQNYLRAVGINASVNMLQVAAAVEKSQKGETPLYHGDWGSYSINDVSAILPVFFGGGNDDYARDPEVQKLLEQGGTTNDPEARKRAYTDAIKRITAEAYFVPLHTFVTTYAHAKNLEFKAYVDELPRFYLSAWN
jgi:peptide/nickel transport system substrate-binding protein